MAQSNLAREPSMDEILASIRKIIESNEATGPGLPANDQRPASDGFYANEHPYLDEEEAEEIHLTIDDNVFPDFDNTIETEQRVMPVLAYAVEEPKPVVAPAPLSLADVAARVRAASERQSYPRDTQPRETQQREAEAREFPARTQAVPRRDAPVMTDNPVAAPAEAPQRRTDAPPVAAEMHTPAEEMRPAEVPQMPAASLPVTEAAIPAQIALDPVAAPAETQAPLPPVPEKETAAILSDAVSEQVSRSFGELALAVDSGSRRSFDEIAEDMLRPMLQDWLDDNLPTLVERLVREEIERVARGPRR